MSLKLSSSSSFSSQLILIIGATLFLLDAGRKKWSILSKVSTYKDL